MSERVADVVSPITDSSLPDKVPLEPFRENLSESGFVLQNFWDNYGQKSIPDPVRRSANDRRRLTDSALRA